MIWQYLLPITTFSHLGFLHFRTGSALFSHTLPQLSICKGNSVSEQQHSLYARSEVLRSLFSSLRFHRNSLCKLQYLSSCSVPTPHPTTLAIMDLVGHNVRFLEYLKPFLISLSKATPASMKAGCGRAVSTQLFLDTTSHKSWQVSHPFHHLDRSFFSPY